jgi:hypothetical protein
MYDPFVRACNCALAELSEINVKGLPQFVDDKQIVFVRNHDRAVKSGNHQRESRVRPDIVLLQWDAFRNWRGHKGATYSQSYNSNICVSKSDFKKNLNWRMIRSTVEMKLGGLPKPQRQTNNFKADFHALEELQPYTSLGDASKTWIIHEASPSINRECASP